MVLHQDSFKRRKLDKVGNHSKFDTGRKKYESDVETGGLGTGFSDLCILQPLYTVNASVNIAPHYLMSSDTHKRDYTATRSYDDSLRCLTCTGKRKLHRVLEKGKPLSSSSSTSTARLSYLPWTSTASPASACRICP